MTLHESSLRIILRDNFKGGFFMSEKMLVTQALDERGWGGIPADC